MQGTTTEDLKLKENKKIELTKMIHKCKDARYERQLPATADIRNYKGRLGRRVGAERGLFFFLYPSGISTYPPKSDDAGSGTQLESGTNWVAAGRTGGSAHSVVHDGAENGIM